MKIRLLISGKIDNKNADALAELYLKRIKHYLPISRQRLLQNFRTGKTLYFFRFYDFNSYRKIMLDALEIKLSKRIRIFIIYFAGN